MIKTPLEILSEVTHHPIEALQNESYTKVKYTFRAIEAYHNQFESKWISVEDRLPESNCNVLTFKTSGIITQMSFHAPFNSKIRKFYWWGFGSWIDQHNQITHWMPLPPNPTT